MIAPIHQHPSPSPAMQDAMRLAWVHLNKKEGHLDSKGHPQPSEGVRYQANIMEGVQFVAEEGGLYWVDVHEKKQQPTNDSHPTLPMDMPICIVETEARKIADHLGYTSVANCSAMFRDAIKYELIDSTVVEDNKGWFMVSEYGWEQLDRWEAA